MRRKDREITETERIRAIIDACKVCRVALQDAEGLYIVPMNFGYILEGGQLSLFFHSAMEGRKVRAFRAGCNVAFEMDCGHALIEGTLACEYGYMFQSVMGTGRIYEVCVPEEKRIALAALMRQQTQREFDFPDGATESVAVFRLDAAQITAKAKGF